MYAAIFRLYLFPFLHQATTGGRRRRRTTPLYLFPFLHQATTSRYVVFVESLLYLFPFLHQATTLLLVDDAVQSCISSLFYIKPQLHFSLYVA